MSPTGIQTKTLFYEALYSRVDVKRRPVLVDIEKQLEKAGRFVALQGAAGGGKSYFLRHQLYDHFKQLGEDYKGGSEGPWRITAFSPQVNPIGTLAAALAEPEVLKGKGAIQPFYREQIEQELRAGNEGIINVFRDAVNVNGKPLRLLILVDQLEDMFKTSDELKRSRNESYTGLGKHFQRGDDALFFNLFQKVLSTEIPIYVLFSIGSENLDRLNAYQGWPERISMHRYSLAPISTEDIEEEILSYWPAEEPLPMPEGARQLYEKMLGDYERLNVENKMATARMNIALKLLYERSSQLLDRPFGGLDQPPAFISRALKKSGTSVERAAEIRGHFAQDEKREEWAQFMADLAPEERKKWDKAVDEYYAQLDRFYYEIGRLSGAPNYFFDSLYHHLSDGQKLLAQRLFQTITRKDASPDRIAESYSTPFSTLVKVCFRNGEEYSDLLKELNQSNTTVIGQEGEISYEDQLREVFRTFNFTGGIIPDLVRWIEPAGQIGSSDSVFLHEDIIIKLGPGNLVQEWPYLRQWVEKEYAAANVYRKLVQDAELYFIEEANNAEEKSKKQANRNAILPNISIWGSSLKKISKAYRKLRHWEDAAETPTRTPNRLLLSEGGVELVGEWYLNTRPNAVWGAKYVAEEIEVNNDDEKPTPFQRRIKEEALTSSILAHEFWTKSNTWHRRTREDNEARIKKETKKQLRITRVMSILAGLAIISLGIVAFLGSRVEEAHNDLRLLDFVDSMTKANLIPSGIYRSPEFRDLKEKIVNDREIREKEDVITTLAEAGVLHYPLSGSNSDYAGISSLALLQLDSLIENYHLKQARSLSSFTSSIAKTGKRAKRLNQQRAGPNYQFPYVYQLLLENLGSLNMALSLEDYAESSSRNTAFKAPTKIVAVASNPKVSDQYAFADAVGEMQIVLKDGRRFNRMQKVPEQVSSLLYSPSGRELFASTFDGNIYRYEPVRSGATKFSPLGLTDSLSLEKISIDGGRRSPRLAILSIHNTADPDYLLVLGDTQLSLIRRTNGNRYQTVSKTDFRKELRELTVAGSNEEGTLFLIGGSGASALMRFDDQSKKLREIRTILHDNICVSAIAFQPSTMPLSSGGALPKVAIGTEAGDIWLTDLNAFQNEGADLFENSNVRTGERNFQESKITGLVFNQTENEQLISSSLDGTIWAFNLEVIPTTQGAFLDRDTGGADWDHLRLMNSGRSVDKLCLVNSNQVVAIENNAAVSWPTNLVFLQEKLAERALDLK